jgi:hypothetical protein
MKTGTGQHDIDAEVLTTESAVEEPFNNVIGQVLEKQKAEGLDLEAEGEQKIHVTFTQDLLATGQLGSFQKDGILSMWSSTLISDENWNNLHNPRPKSDAAQKSHSASIFNKGLSSSFEHLSCDTCYAFRQHLTADGKIIRQIIRYGKSLDKAAGSEWIQVVRVHWDSRTGNETTKNVSRLDRARLELASPIEPIGGANEAGDALVGLDKLWAYFAAKAERHGSADGDFFATAFMPIREIAGKKLLIVDEVGELCFFDSICYKPLRKFYSEAYMYKSTGLSAPVGHVRAIIQGKELKLDDTVWDSIDASPSQVYKIHSSQDGSPLVATWQCKALSDLEIKRGIKPGVRIALKHSTKIVNNDPENFFDDRMCDERVQTGGETLKSKHRTLMEKGSNAQKKVVFNTKGPSLLDPRDYMDKDPEEFSPQEFNAFVQEATNFGGKNKGDQHGAGKHLISMALGFKHLILVELKIDLHTNSAKSIFIKRPVSDSQQDAPWSPGEIIGMIYREIVEQVAFPEARKELCQMRALRASAFNFPLVTSGSPPPPGNSAMVPYVPTEREPERRGERSRLPSQRLQIDDDRATKKRRTSDKKEKREVAFNRFQDWGRQLPEEFRREFETQIKDLKQLMQ